MLILNSHKDIHIDTLTNIIDGTFEELSNMVTYPYISDKKEFCKYIMPYNYSTTARYRTDIESFNVLFLDYDDNADMNELISRFKSFKFIIHTSFSHQYGFKQVGDKLIPVEPKNKFRVILFLNKAYDPEFYMNSSKTPTKFLKSKCDNGESVVKMPGTIMDGIDIAAFKKLGFYAPTINSNVKDSYKFFINDGELFDLEKWFIDNGIKEYSNMLWISLIKPTYTENSKEEYAINLKAKYKRTITHNCQNRNTGVHAMMCTVASGLRYAGCSEQDRIDFMIDLFKAVTNSDKLEITNIVRGIK